MTNFYGIQLFKMNNYNFFWTKTFVMSNILDSKLILECLKEWIHIQGILLVKSCKVWI